jgi:hypothetical protein
LPLDQEFNITIELNTDNVTFFTKFAFSVANSISTGIVDVSSQINAQIEYFTFKFAEF